MLKTILAFAHHGW